MQPWDYHPDLTSDRLIKIAQLIHLGRRDAVERHEPSIGADAWTRGVCAYRFACYRINQAAGTLRFEWLSIIDPGKRFQFRVGEAPMRFWRGDVAEPAGHITIPTPTEQLTLDLGRGAVLDGILFRINVVTDDDGGVLQASFVALRNKQAETVWPIPFEGAEPLLFVLGEDRPQGRDLPPPLIDLLKDDNIEEDGEESTAE